MVTDYGSHSVTYFVHLGTYFLRSIPATMCTFSLLSLFPRIKELDWQYNVVESALLWSGETSAIAPASLLTCGVNLGKSLFLVES